MKKYFTIIIAFLFMFSCKDDDDMDINKNTYTDDITDITYLNGRFYTTNYDLSGNAGPQIDLFKFSSDGQVIEDAFPLSINGQGYLAITTDSTDLYLQSRSQGSLIKVSPVGEMIYMKWDSVSNNNWSPSGICYLSDLDSLLLLYRNSLDRSNYRVRVVNKDDPDEASKDFTVEWNFVDTTNYGVYALDYYDSYFYLLGVDTAGTDIYFRTDNMFNPDTLITIPDSTVVGISVAFRPSLETYLYLSYRDRRIESWGELP